MNEKNILDEQRRERVNGFIKELNALTEKYQISIGGCGCCGSPYLIDQKTYDGYDAMTEINSEICYDLAWDFDWDSGEFGYTTTAIKHVVIQREDWSKIYRYNGSKKNESKE